MCQNGHEFVVLLTCFAWNITESTTDYTLDHLVEKTDRSRINGDDKREIFEGNYLVCKFDMEWMKESKKYVMNMRWVVQKNSYKLYLRMDLLNHSVIYFICRKRRPFWSLWHLSHNSLCSKVKRFWEFQDTFCFFFFVIFSREGKCKNRIKNNRCQNKTINHIVKNIICENLDPCRFLSFWQQQHADVASWRLVVNLPCPPSQRFLYDPHGNGGGVRVQSCPMVNCHGFVPNTCQAQNLGHQKSISFSPIFSDPVAGFKSNLLLF